MNIGSILVLNLVIGVTSGSIDNWGISVLIAVPFRLFSEPVGRLTGKGLDQRTWKEAV